MINDPDRASVYRLSAVPVREARDVPPEVLEVSLDDQLREVDSGTTIYHLIGREQIERTSIIAALLDNHLVSLHTPLVRGARVVTVLEDSPLGEDVCKRSIAHMLHAVLAERFPELTFVVGQSLMGGYFYELQVAGEPYDGDLESLARIAGEGLRALVEARAPFEISYHYPDDALDQLSDPGGAKSRLLATWPSMLVPMIALAGFTDIPHGPYAPDSGVGRLARVIPYPPGIVLQFRASDEHAERKATRLWACYRETRDWNHLVKVPSVGHLNEAVLQDRIDEVVRISEALHEKKIVEIVGEITARRSPVRLICVAGPSSAGKSTFVRRLAIQLRVCGIEPLIVGLDNYYLDRDKCPRDELGEYDFEALEALNLELINAHFAALLRGEPVSFPVFDFATGLSSVPETDAPVSLSRDQILIVEGIHGLHPSMTRSVPGASVYKIFVNALTQLMLDAHNRLHTADTRLIRRIVRDRLYRHTVAADTIARWPSVRRGERRHIFPFQEEADIMFNSSLVYEHAVMKTQASRYLLEVPRDHPSRAVAHRLLGFLDLFVGVLPDEVPGNSVLREFIGGNRPR